MIERKLSYLLIASIAISSISCASYIPQSRGRKLFGGYRIAPKICEPTNPGRIKSNAPAICMFNYECSRRKGEVVGACMDGFLFGACCQLPTRESIDNFEKISISEDPLLNIHELDHVPDIPILLNPDGTPVGSIVSDPTTKSTFSSVKLSTTSPKNNYKNTERPQFVDLSHLENDFSILLGHDQILDDLKLPSLITHSDSNNDIHEQQHHHEAPVDSPVTTLLSPDQILQVADPVDQLPALFSHGLHQNNETGAETILLNENGKPLNDSYNPDDIFKPTNIENITVQTTTEKLRTSLKTLPARHSTIQMTPMTERTTAAAKKATTTTVSSTHKNTQKSPNTKNTVKTTTNAIKSTNKTSTSTKKATTPISTKTKLTPATTKSSSSSTYSATTPMTLSTRDGEDLIRVPTITYGGQSGNKKHDELDKEEIAINHIISILNDTKITTQVTNGPTTYKWVSPDGLSKPTLVKISTSYPSSGSTESLPSSYYNSASSPNYYQYNVAPTEPSRPISSYYTSSDSLSSYSTQSGNYLDSSASTSGSSSSNNYGYSSRPTTNPPAPTVIVLGPLGTDYTTIPTQSTPTRFDSTQKYSDVATKVTTNTARPNLITSKPSVSTTFTHNISTVISGNKQVVSVSVVSVNSKDGTTTKPTTLKDKIDQAIADSNSDTKFVTKRPSTVYTTLTSWSEKPGFYLKPSSPNFEWPIDNSDDESDKVTKPEYTTTGSNCDEETVTSDDVNNFPPVRHPELESSVTHLQEKPTPVEGDEIITEDEIPTPDFVEDAELNNKVDVFVNKIVESLQGNFQNLKDVVYNPKNVSTVAPSVVTKKPVAAATTKRPATTKPTIKGTRRPITTRVTTTQKISTAKPKPTSVGTRKPTVTTKRTKPVKKTTTPIPVTNTEVEAELETTTTVVTTKLPEIKPDSDFRTICGIRPLYKSGRIVGGKGVHFAEYPWQVLVREATWLGLFTKNKCGGVLITDKYVITAAHCQPGFLASLVAVFGEYDISGELEPKRSVTRNVRRVIVNRAYDPATFENDLALLELETPIQFDGHIVPVCMPDEETDYVNRIAVVTGWGRLKYNGGVPSVLQEVRVPIMENAVCQDMFRAAGHSKLILDSFMCAGYANGQKDSCEGDSGGPLTIQRSDGRWVLVGTVSHGIKCAAPYLPGVYMRTTYFKPWLHSITGV